MTKEVTDIFCKFAVLKSQILTTMAKNMIFFTVIFVVLLLVPDIYIAAEYIYPLGIVWLNSPMTSAEPVRKGTLRLSAMTDVAGVIVIC